MQKRKQKASPNGGLLRLRESNPANNPFLLLLAGTSSLRRFLMQTAVEITLTQEELLATLRRLRILCRTFIVYRYPSCDPDKDIWGLTTEEEKERKELLAKLPHPANFRVHSSLDPPHERDEYEDWPLPYGLTLVFFRMLLERCGCQNCAPREEKWLIVQKQ